MVRICRTSILGAVTAYTFNRRSAILIARCVGVARLARQHPVPAEKCEACLFVFPDHVSDLPRLHRMTAQAVFAQLALMHIRVARSAGRPGSGEFQIGMACRARNGLMLPHKFEPGRSVVERSIFPHFPAVRRMARLARERQRAVR